MAAAAFNGANDKTRTVQKKKKKRWCERSGGGGGTFKKRQQTHARNSSFTNRAISSPLPPFD